MKYFKFSDAESLSEYMNHDSVGEIFGEKVITISGLDELESSEAEYVLFGIPSLSNSNEDFKIENFDMFQMVLKNLLTIQNNQFNRGEHLVILGELDVELISKEINELKTNPPAFLGRARLRDLDGQAGSEKRNKFNDLIAKLINETVLAICTYGKIPIVVGGEHHNSLDILKGVSLSESDSVNLLDLSSQFNLELENHTDLLQPNEMYYNAEFLNKYYSFGLHKNYVTQKNIDKIQSSKTLSHYFYEDCLHLTTLDKCIRFKNAIDFLNRKSGFKLDIKSIQGMSSQCDSSSGFSVRDIRTFIKVIRKEQIQFFHICEFEADFKENIGHTLSYFISDFMRNDD